MEIKTKFNIGDEAYLFIEGDLKEILQSEFNFRVVKIKEIIITKEEKYSGLTQEVVKYRIDNQSTFSEMFLKTKEELLEVLRDKLPELNEEEI